MVSQVSGLMPGTGHMPPALQWTLLSISLCSALFCSGLNQGQVNDPTRFSFHSLFPVRSSNSVTRHSWYSLAVWLLIFHGTLADYGYFLFSVRSGGVVTLLLWYSQKVWLLMNIGTLNFFGSSSRLVLSSLSGLRYQWNPQFTWLLHGFGALRWRGYSSIMVRSLVTVTHQAWCSPQE